MFDESWAIGDPIADAVAVAIGLAWRDATPAQREFLADALELGQPEPPHTCDEQLHPGRESGMVG
jgi:hypothetical protein